MTTILTLTLDTRAQAHFDTLRRQYYPPALNRIAAHLTLFHTLPATEHVRATILETCAHTQAFHVEVTSLMSLGRGVAFRCQSPTLQHLHSKLGTAFAAYLSPQDRQGFRPHVVIQNKATGDSARALLASLTPAFTPWHFSALGLSWWNYENGPWSLREHLPFL